MTFDALARAYIAKARLRLKMVEFLLGQGGFSDVVRESQELVELATKAMLRRVGVEPPKWHDVGGVLTENATLFTEAIQRHLTRVAQISKRLRKEREFSFYGDDDFIPTDEYDQEMAERCIADARWVLEIAEQVVTPGTTT